MDLVNRASDFPFFPSVGLLHLSRSSSSYQVGKRPAIKWLYKLNEILKPQLKVARFEAQRI
jgi:hypothetical protein